MSRAAPGTPLKAGVAEIDISPPIGVQLVGYPTVIRENTGIHDPLFADCIVLDDEQTRVAVITSDIVGLTKDFVRRLRTAVQDDTGICGANVLISSSHTHSGPRVNEHMFDDEVAMGGLFEAAYLETLLERLRGLVTRAMAGIRDARIGFGRGVAGAEKGIGGNRQDPSGLADPGVGVIGVQDEEGEWMAVLVKYSLHPTILQMDNTLVSADYPWGIRALIKQRYPRATFFFALGATGDQSSRYFRNGQTFDEAERFGRVIGEEADRVLGSLEWEQEPVLGSLSAEVDPVWKEIPPVHELEQLVAHYWEQLHALEARQAPYVEQQTCYLDRLGVELTLGMARMHARGEKAPWEHDAPLEVHALRIGDSCIVGIAGEIFVEYTLAIEKNPLFSHMFVFTLSNGMSPGYVVDKTSAEKHTFEAGASMMKPETGERILDAAARLTSDLRAR